MTKSQTNLVDYLTNVRYELDMMRFNLLRAREASVKGPDGQLDYNSHYESWAIHARNLYKFLNNDDDKRSNYQAHDYAPNFSCSKSEDTKRIFPKLGPEIFHMGTRRPKTVNEQVQLTDVNVFTEWIEDAFEDFLIKVRTGPYSGGWREASMPRNSPVAREVPPSATNQIYVSSSAAAPEKIRIVSFPAMKTKS